MKFDKDEIVDIIHMIYAWSIEERRLYHSFFAGAYDITYETCILKYLF